MVPEHFQFGGGLKETMVHPLVLAAMIVAVVLILLLPRKYVIVPLLLVAFLVPLGQQFVLGGIHLMVLRVLILTGCIRMLWTRVSSKTGTEAEKFNSVDKAFTLWAIFRALATVLLYLSAQAVIGEFGFLWDVIGGYFLLRFLIQDEEDIGRTAATFAVIAALLAMAMLNEKFRNENIFGFLGGVPIVPTVREGTIRAQGPFAHAILAGTFGGTLLPLFVWLWKSGRSKVLSTLGVFGSTAIALTAASSTAIMAYAAGIFGICFWPFRKHMRSIRWGFVILLVALHLVMKAPVWFLIARVEIVGGSTSYQRALLIDQFVRHFGDWWLFGTFDSDDWGADMWDHTNQFVAEGEQGGLATLVFFIAMICICFGRLGTARKSVEGDTQKEWFFWILGTTLFAHIVGFLGISYFDQTRISWFALLAMISAATAPVLAKVAARQQPESSLTGGKLLLPHFSKSTKKGLLR